MDRIVTRSIVHIPDRKGRMTIHNPRQLRSVVEDIGMSDSIEFGDAGHGRGRYSVLYPVGGDSRHLKLFASFLFTYFNNKLGKSGHSGDGYPGIRVYY